MYHIYRENKDVKIKFEINDLGGICNMTQGIVEDIILPNEEEFDSNDAATYIEALTAIQNFAEPLMGTTETDNYICLLAQPNIRITTDIKLKQEVEPDA